MSSEYNSKLISRLYEARNGSEADKVLNQMSDIKDPVFVYPIFKAWQKSNEANDTRSHFFISTLQNINSRAVLEVALEIFKMSKSTRDVIWVYPIFEKYDYFDEGVISKAIDILAKELSGEYSLLDFNVGDLLSYLSKAKMIVKVEDNLLNIVIKDDIDFDVRKVSLRYLLRINPKKELQVFIDKYEDTQSEDLDILLAKELIGWTGELSEKLRGIIGEKGNDRAKEILEEFKVKQDQETKKDQEKESAKFGNIELVYEISELRKKINRDAILNPSVSSELFLDNNYFLIEQQRIIHNKEEFVDRCNSLRSLLNNFSPVVKNHGVGITAAKKLLPKIREDDLGKELNSMFLFLNSKNIYVPSDLYGLRKLNQFISLVFHKDQLKDLREVAIHLKLDDLYKKENWQELHRSILIIYKEILQKISDALIKGTTSENPIPSPIKSGQAKKSFRKSSSSI